IQCPATLAVVANILGAVLSATCIPASTKGASANAQAPLPGSPQARVFDLKAITRLLLLPDVLGVFLVKVVSGFPSGLFMVMFSVICMDFFQLEAAQAGYLMSFFGVLQMVRRSTGPTGGAGVFGRAMMSGILHFCLLVPGLVFSLCTLNVVTDSMLTKAVSASDT
ncbi:solute carrier family 22 member 18, partial [Carlito syrichta]|uniref:Solute carrier family 22 member 18 n=1 Tax=Carlito syrichta TaxID=1868482 RepID=A0A3Q0DPJ7_CARSF